MGMYYDFQFFCEENFHYLFLHFLSCVNRPKENKSNLDVLGVGSGGGMQHHDTALVQVQAIQTFLKTPSILLMI